MCHTIYTAWKCSFCGLIRCTKVDSVTPCEPVKDNKKCPGSTEATRFQDWICMECYIENSAEDNTYYTY